MFSREIFCVIGLFRYTEFKVTITSFVCTSLSINLTLIFSECSEVVLLILDIISILSFNIFDAHFLYAPNILFRKKLQKTQVEHGKVSVLILKPLRLNGICAIFTMDFIPKLCK